MLPIQAFARTDGRQNVPNWVDTVVGVLLIMLVAVPGQLTTAQIQMDQAEPIASQLEGVTQGQVVVTLPGDCEPNGATCEEVDRSEVLGLIPDDVPTPASSASGNSAVVVQRGARSDARVEQVGSENEVSLTQLGGIGNDARVLQSGGMSGTGAMPGHNNLAVVVQIGSLNETAVKQWGDDNLAGIRLVGNQNRIALTQDGSGNEYLLDFAGSNLGSMGSSRSHQVSQIGNNNRLVQVGSGSMPFNVRQQGNGMRMRIHHGAP